MKKSLITALILSTLTILGTAFAADGPSSAHKVTINIPEMLSLRIIGTSGNSAASNPAVDFDFVTNQQPYLDKLAAGGGQIAPTNVTDFKNVIVLSNKTAWVVNVKADSELKDPLNNVVSGAGISLSDIAIKGGSITPDAGVTRFDIDNLSTSDQTVASGAKTKGWTGIGIGGLDYLLDVQGDEAVNTYHTTVTYTVSAP